MTDGGELRLRADVCVVGAGPAGLTVASELSRAGFEVLLLEAGQDNPPAGGEDVTDTAVVGLPYPLRRSRAAGVGGSGLRWDIPSPAGGPHVRLRQLDRLDLVDRPGLRRGWPLAYDELEPWYARAWGTFGLRPAPDPPEEESAGPLRPAVYTFGPASTFTDRLPAELRGSARVRLLTQTRAVDIRTDDADDEVSALWCTSSEGRLVVQATHYVLACGGVENARLLLASRSRRPEGLGNHDDQVGRCFMEHPHYASGLLVLSDGALLRERTRWDVVAVGGRLQQRKHRLSDDLLQRHGLPGGAFYVTPRSARKPVQLRSGELDTGTTAAVHEVRMAVLEGRWDAASARHLGRALFAAPHLVMSAARQAAAIRAARRGRPGRGPLVFSLNVMAEQLPLSQSRLRLVDGPHDDGLPPKAELDWRASPVDVEALRLRHELAAPALEGVFGGRVLSLVDPVRVPHIGGGYHHMGTTRMSALPADGVVDADCRLHGMRNTWLAGSSVFATGGYANPTLTLVALAHRLAHRLVRELSG